MGVLSHRLARICALFVLAFGLVVWPSGFVASTKIPSKSLAVRGCQAESAEAWEELVNELAKQNDQDKAKLLLRALAAEMKAQT